MLLLQSPSSVTTDSGSMNEDGDNNETESETTDMACVTTSNTTAVTTSVPIQDVPKIKTDISEQGKY